MDAGAQRFPGLIPRLIFYSLRKTVKHDTVELHLMISLRRYFQIVLALFISFIFFIPALSFGDQSSNIPQGTHQGLQFLDWLMIALYASVVMGIGIYYSRKQTSTEEYFLGNRSMGSFVTGISIAVSILSTISFLAKPGEMIRYGPTNLWAIAAVPFFYIAIGYFLIPAFMKQKITSAYELLEHHLGLSVRLFGSIVFIVTRLVWMALLIFLASKAIVVMFGWPASALPYVVMTAGLISVAYTTIGGLRAVIITDVLQFFTLMGGALLTMAIISIKMGGITQWIPTEWPQNWVAQPFFSFDPHVRVTVVGSIVLPIFFWICVSGSDQMAIQRYLATKNLQAARRSFLIFSIAQAVIVVLLSIVGLALMGYFQSISYGDGQAGSLLADADYLFPHYIANYLPAGVAGLVVSGIFAAAMSSLDSGINSIVSIITVDFVNRFSRTQHTQRHNVKLAKYLVFGIGVAVVLVSTLMDKVPGNITEVTNKTNGLFIGPLFGLFFMALFIPFATPFGTIVGGIYGVAAAILYAYWDVITGNAGFSFQWIIPVSLVVHISLGSVLSLLFARDVGRRSAVIRYVLALIPLVGVLFYFR